MAHILETDPTLLSPLNWGGRDINNPNHFIDTMEETCPSPGRIAEKAAKLILTSTLNMVYQGNDFRERPVVPAHEGQPVGDSLNTGSIVILEHELLHRSVRLLADRSLRSRVSTTPMPIGRQFAGYWRNNIDRYDDLGREHMFFPEVGAQYSRYLHWGVVVQSKRCEPTIVSYAFNEPYLRGERVVLPPRNSTNRSVQPLPFEIGINKTTRIIDAEQGGFVIYRATGLRELQVYPRVDDFRKKHLEHAFVERVRKRLREIAESLQPTPIPGF